MSALLQIQAILGQPIEDPEEEAFLVFSQAIPSQSLGFVDDKATAINITVADRDLTIHQSRGLLTSDRKQGTTGAVVWKVTPLFAEWMASANFLFAFGYLSQESTVLELGSGVSGVVAVTLGPKVKQYFATDQDYVIRLLKQNITENLPAITAKNPKQTSKSKRKAPRSHHSEPRIEALQLDWELDSVSSFSSILGDEDQGVDVVLACDCIYNDALIEPLNNTCTQICQIRSRDSTNKPTLCLVAQQLRSNEVFEDWLKSFRRTFHVWRVPDALLTDSLKENSGFIVHVGLLR